MNLLAVAVVVTIAFLVVALIAAQVMFRRHRGVSREQFIKAFSGTEIPAEVPAAVYDFYKKHVVFKNFSIAPDDTYDEQLREGEEDIEDDARFLMKKLGLQPPSLEVQQQWSEQMLSSRMRPQNTPKLSADSSKLLQPIQTVRDMVLWLDWVRQHQHVPVSE
ncbi:MAG: hypothetical protein JO356_06530 [Acidobacteria bacterium]|nr:hypothetical protein [Acidobacteriota bacterium]